MARVLVVDDEEDIRETLRDILEYRGLDVTTAADGALGLAALRDGERPCLVLVDLVMPVMDGWELLAAIDEDPSLDDVVVAISTSTPDRAPAGHQVFPKPLDLRAFLARVDEVCSKGC